MIAPFAFTEFETEGEKLEYYKRYSFLAKTKTDIPVLLYSGAYTDYPCNTDIIGYIDDHTCVIKLNGKIHTIMIDFLLQMQKVQPITNCDMLQKLKELCSQEIKKHNVFSKYFCVSENKNIYGDLVSYEFTIGDKLIGITPFFRWSERDKYFSFNEQAVKTLKLNNIFTSIKLFKRQANTYYRCYYSNISSDIYDIITSVIEYTILNFKSTNVFGCCSRYLDCSNAKKCLHPDKLYLTGCQYYQNLTHGFIFYGVNKTNNGYYKGSDAFRNTKPMFKKQQEISSYIVFDIETTGFSYKNGTDKIIEICAIKIDNGEVIEEFSSLVQPERNIPNEIIQLTGITNDMVYDAPLIEEILPEFLNFIGDLPLIGHNINGFDLNFINKFCELLNLPCIDNDSIDTWQMARKRLPLLKHHKLEDIVEYFGIKNDQAHRALSDCYATWECYKKLLEI